MWVDPLLWVGGASPLDQTSQSGEAWCQRRLPPLLVVRHLLPLRDHLLPHLAGFPLRHMLPVSPSSSVCFSSCSIAPGCCPPPVPPPTISPNTPSQSIWSSISSFVSRVEGEKKPVCATNSTVVTTKSRDPRRDLAAAVRVYYDSNALTSALFHLWHDGCDAFDVNLEQITSLHGEKKPLWAALFDQSAKGYKSFFMIVSSWFSLLRRLLHCGEKKQHFHWSKSSASELETTFVVVFFPSLIPFLSLQCARRVLVKVFQRSWTKNCGAGIKERRFGVLFRFNWRFCVVSTHSVIIVMYIFLTLF